MSKKILLPLEEVAIKYEETKSINQIAKYFNVSWQVAKNACEQLGIISQPKNQYSERKTYNLFQKIENEEQAYWLGFLYADGWIRSDKNEIGLGVQERDKEILEKFKKFVDSDNKIQIREKEKTKSHSAPDGHIIITKQNFYSFTFSDKQTKENLILLGCVPNKSKIIHCPNKEQVSDELFRHFMRGFTDGDGSLRWGTRKDFVLTSASINFLIEATIRLQINNYGDFYKEQFRIGKKQLVQKVFELLYGNSNIYLQRKYDIYLLSK